MPAPAESTLLITRNLLPAASFRYSLHRARIDHERSDLGSYYPVTRLVSLRQAGMLGCHG
jgi:hypothetical protein